MTSVWNEEGTKPQRMRARMVSVLRILQQTMPALAVVVVCASAAADEAPGPCGWSFDMEEGGTLIVPKDAPVVLAGSLHEAWNCSNYPMDLTIVVTDQEGRALDGMWTEDLWVERVAWRPITPQTPNVLNPGNYTLSLQFWYSPGEYQEHLPPNGDMYDITLNLVVVDEVLGAPVLPPDALELELWSEDNSRVTCCPDDVSGETCVVTRCDRKLEGQAMWEPPTEETIVDEGGDRRNWWVYVLEKRFTDDQDGFYVRDIPAWHMRSPIQHDVYIRISEPWPEQVCVRLLAREVGADRQFAQEVFPWTCQATDGIGLDPCVEEPEPTCDDDEGIRPDATTIDGEHNSDGHNGSEDTDDDASEENSVLATSTTRGGGCQTTPGPRGHGMIWGMLLVCFGIAVHRRRFM